MTELPNGRPPQIVLRRSWPQRIVMAATLAVIAAALLGAWLIGNISDAVAGFGRVSIAGDVLLTETAVGEPVNFLLIGNDSALGIDPDDPIHIGRGDGERSAFNADSIALLRVDPTQGRATVLSVPRDLLTDHIPGASRNRINAALRIGGPQTLVETITSQFGIEINHYVELNFLAFRELVDVLGGVPVWFDYPARDLNSGLHITEPGCHLLDGVGALAYVRSRRYQELTDGRWVLVGNSDFGRIERQQDFMVLALRRAISRGIRNPTTLAGLIEAGASSVILDERLTPAELIDLGQAFSDFNPSNLARLELKVATIYNSEGIYVGEQLVADVNEEAFNIFRGLPSVGATSAALGDVEAGDGQSGDDQTGDGQVGVGQKGVGQVGDGGQSGDAQVGQGDSTSAGSELTTTAPPAAARGQVIGLAPEGTACT